MSAADFFDWSFGAGAAGGGGLVGLLCMLVKYLKKNFEWFAKFCDFIHKIFCDSAREKKNEQHRKKVNSEKR